MKYFIDIMARTAVYVFSISIILALSGYKVKTPRELYRDMSGLYVEYPMRGEIMAYLLNEDGSMCFGTYKNGILNKRMCGTWSPTSQISFRYILRAHTGVLVGEFSYLEEIVEYQVYEEEWGGKIVKIGKDGEFIE